MASTYSPKLRFELVGSGEQAGLWGTTTNKNIGQLIEQAIAGVTTVELDGLSGNYTLTTLDGTPDQSRSAVIKCTYSSVPASGAINLIIPTQTKLYVVRNDCGQLLTVKTSGQTGGVELQDGEATLVFCDGTNAILGLETAAAGTLGVDGGGTGRSTFTAGVLYSSGGTNALSTYTSSAAIPVAYGGTGQNTLTANNVLLGNGTSALQVVAPGTSGNVLTSNGTTWVSSTPTSSGVTSITASTGLSASSSTGAVTLTNTGVTSLTAGSGISLSGSTGSITVTNSVNPSDYVTVAGTQTISGIKTFSGGAVCSAWNFTATGNSFYYQTSPNRIVASVNSGTSFVFRENNSNGGNFSGVNLRVGEDLGSSTGTNWSFYSKASGGGIAGAFYGQDSGTSAIAAGVNNTGGSLAIFFYGTPASNSQVGTITTNGSSTNYNTSSDYRLKDNVQDMVGAVDKIKSLRPVTYTWKNTGTSGQGFIAHELQAVVPEAVTGEKDGAKEDGTPIYQGVDTSHLVATLTSALQAAFKTIDSLETRIAALEAK